MDGNSETSNNTSSLLHIIVIGFHHKKGCQVRTEQLQHSSIHIIFHICLFMTKVFLLCFTDTMQFGYFVSVDGLRSQLLVTVVAAVLSF